MMISEKERQTLGYNVGDKCALAFALTGSDDYGVFTDLYMMQSNGP